MQSLPLKKYDCIIIGAGFSGLAAAVRLAHFNKKVCICEQHCRLGGLNSWYKKNGFEIDSGLHAMTNFTPHDGHKSLPLKKLLRQLRIPYEALELCQQKQSSVIFPQGRLDFSNNFEMLKESVCKLFPDDVDDFLKLDAYIRDYNGVDVDASYNSTISMLKKKLKNDLLIDMLLCPVSFYGSAWENDMDFGQFSIMYKSIFHEGFCVPAGGVQALIKLLKNRFIESGGILTDYKKSHIMHDKALLTNAPVKKILQNNGTVSGIELESGDILASDCVISSAGLLETLHLTDAVENSSFRPGSLGFTETIAFFENNPVDYDDTIVFFSQKNRFDYSNPESLFSTNSGVICTPGNYNFLNENSKPEHQIRITLLADYQKWAELDSEAYADMKSKTAVASLKTAADIMNLKKFDTKLIDVFTPCTIKKFTGHLNGAIYGSPDKIKNGKTTIENLFLCGTDQGFLGITGAMLSGISIANMYAL